MCNCWASSALEWYLDPKNGPEDLARGSRPLIIPRDGYLFGGQQVLQSKVSPLRTTLGVLVHICGIHEILGLFENL